jgi:hypothetical protein
MDSVTEALAVIEQLRDYHPKHIAGQKSGTRTPVFGSLGFSPSFNDKEQFPSMLSGALRAATPDHHHHQRRHVSEGTPERDGAEDGDGDTEDGERTVVGTVSSRKSMMMGSTGKGKQKKRSSWMGSRQNTDGTIRSQNNYTHSPSPSRPMTPSGLQPHPQANSSPHRYPPSAVDGDGAEGGATIVHAAKVLKTAVLHDARYITKGISNGLGGIVSNVNSAHEAKVRLPYPFCHSFTHTGFTESSASPAPFTCASKTNTESTCSLPTSTPPFPLPLSLNQPSASSTKTTMATSPVPRSKPPF